MTNTTITPAERLEAFADTIDDTSYGANLARDIRAVLTRLHEVQLEMAAAWKAESRANAARDARAVDETAIEALLALGWPRDTGISPGDWATQVRGDASDVRKRAAEYEQQRDAAVLEKHALETEVKAAMRAAKVDLSIGCLAGAKVLAGLALRGEEEAAKRWAAESSLTGVRAVLSTAGIREELPVVDAVQVLAAGRDQLAEDMTALLMDQQRVREAVRGAGVPDGLDIPAAVEQLAANFKASQKAHGRNMAQWQRDELDAVQSAMPPGFSLVCHPQTPGDSRVWFGWRTEESKTAAVVGSPHGALKLAWSEYCRVLASDLDKARALAESIVALVNKPEPPPVDG